MTRDPLSQLTATLVCCTFGLLYVLPLYTWGPARTGKGRTRDHPDVIRARVTAIALATLLDCALAYLVVSRIAQDPVNGSLDKPCALLYFRLPDSFLAVLLAPLAYAGSLVSAAVSGELRQSLGLRTWQGLRAYLVAPITEEVVFRSCCLAISSLAGSSMVHMVWVTPLYFGIAHLHHGWESYRLSGRNRRQLPQILVATLVQLSYTTLFGAFASFLTVRTGSIIPAISAHVFCNFMGLPSIADEAWLHPCHKLWLYAVHVLGIAGFSYCLYPWTASS